MLLTLSRFSQGTPILTISKKTPSLVFNFYAVIAFPLKISWGNYFKLQWKTFWQGKDDKVREISNHLKIIPILLFFLFFSFFLLSFSFSPQFLFSSV